MSRAATVAALSLLLAWPAVARAAPPAAPDRAAIEAAVEAVRILPVPEPVEGELSVEPATTVAGLRQSYLADMASEPGWLDNVIVVASGTHRLEAVAAALDRPRLLDCGSRRGQCRLAAPLVVESGATLVVDRLNLALEQAAGAVLVAYGDLFVSIATIRGSAGPTEGGADDVPAETDGERFRPYVLVYDGSRTVIRDSRIAHLGYDAFDRTGLTLALSRDEEPPDRPALRFVANLVESGWDGITVRGAGKADIFSSRIRDSLHHGVVARDNARGLRVAGNDIAASGLQDEKGHGLVVTRGVGLAVVAGNRIGDSADSGILIERGSHDLTISGNEIVQSGSDGLVVYEGRAVDILGNGVSGSGRSGVRVRASDTVRIEGNRLADNAREGIHLHDWSRVSREPRRDERELIRPVSVTVEGNRYAGNGRGDCAVEGEVTVLPPDGFECRVD